MEGKGGGGESPPLPGGSSPLDGEEAALFWPRLASYSKVRLGLGTGLTGVPGAPVVGWPAGSGL